MRRKMKFIASILVFVMMTTGIFNLKAVASTLYPNKYMLDVLEKKSIMENENFDKSMFAVLEELYQFINNGSVHISLSKYLDEKGDDILEGMKFAVNFAVNAETNSVILDCNVADSDLKYELQGGIYVTEEEIATTMPLLGNSDKYYGYKLDNIKEQIDNTIFALGSKSKYALTDEDIALLDATSISYKNSLNGIKNTNTMTEKSVMEIINFKKPEMSTVNTMINDNWAKVNMVKYSFSEEEIKQLYANLIKIIYSNESFNSPLLGYSIYEDIISEMITEFNESFHGNIDVTYYMDSNDYIMLEQISGNVIIDDEEGIFDLKINYGEHPKKTDKITLDLTTDMGDIKAEYKIVNPGDNYESNINAQFVSGTETEKIFDINTKWDKKTGKFTINASDLYDGNVEVKGTLKWAKGKSINLKLESVGEKGSKPFLTTDLNIKANSNNEVKRPEIIELFKLKEKDIDKLLENVLGN